LGNVLGAGKLTGSGEAAVLSLYMSIVVPVYKFLTDSLANIFADAKE
jgi:hypothetical protein